MATSDLDQLIDMGFDKEKAEMAVKKTGGLTDAIDWLDKNADTSIESLKAEDAKAAEEKAAEAAAEARSLKCNECNKVMRGTREAEFHASKSGHQDFSESTEEVKPLSEEEKAARLEELRQKLAAKRAAMATEDKLAADRNQKISMKKNKESEDLKEDLKKRQTLKEAAEKKAERQADLDAKKRIQARIAADKEERRLKAEQEKAARAGQAPPPIPAVAPQPTPPSTSKPASEYTETRLRLQTPNGNVLKSFPVTTTLFEVASAVADEIGQDVESFTQTFPKKTFDKEYFGESLKDLKLVPSASLIVK